MDSKSWSSILRLLLMVIGGFIIAQLAAFVIMAAYGYNISELQNSGGSFLESANVGMLKLTLFVSHIFLFIIPTLLFAHLNYGSEKWSALNLNQKINYKQFLIACLFMVVSYGAVTYSYELNSMIPLADWMHSQEDNTALTLEKILEMKNAKVLIINLILIAIIPGIGEELLFRGLIQNILLKGLKNGHLAVWVSAFVFSFFHLQFEGFLPRLLLGAILGYAFLWTKNLWIPIILHMLNNALPILSLYYLKTDLTSIDPSKAEPVAWYVGLISVILGIVVGKYFMKNSSENEYA